jgi:glutamate--cysteine ligase
MAMKDPNHPLLDALQSLWPRRLEGMRRGIEKESLRVRPDGSLALTPHPAALGSALTHPRITTDFSESQLELITGVHDNAQSCLDELTRIHQFVYRSIDDEMLWVASMPCGLPADETIPIARYGTSNIGRAKSVYRVGLGHRYGRRMQAISGIHYNWSMPGVSNDDYFALIRNFRRHAFLLVYLFGASPAVCSSFVADRAHGLQPLAGHTLGLPHATSLRVGRLGYQSDAQAALAVSYNSLDSYAASLRDALSRPHPAYEALGLRNADGEYNQLSTALLQIENEFYGMIRPKRVIDRGQRPLQALLERGVEYVEVRCMDLDPFLPIGIAAPTLRFLDVFLLHCLLTDSPPDTPQEIAALARNQERVSARGRQPGLQLERGPSEVGLIEWGRQLLGECAAIAEVLDSAAGGNGHRDAVRAARAALVDTNQLPSARVLAAMASDFDGSYVRFARTRSESAKRDLLALPWSDAEAAHFRALSETSLREQLALEASEGVSFEVFRQRYLAPERLRPAHPNVTQATTAGPSA